MILHFSQIRLTDGLTFMILSSIYIDRLFGRAPGRRGQPNQHPVGQRLATIVPSTSTSAEALTRAYHAMASFGDGIARLRDPRHSRAGSGSGDRRSVTAIVCSKCAASLPSAVTTVQPSRRRLTSEPPCGDHRLDGQDQPRTQLDAGARVRRSWGPAAPRASLGRRRGRRARGRRRSRCSRRAPGRRRRYRRGDCRRCICAMPSIRHSCVTSSSRCAASRDRCRSGS